MRTLAKTNLDPLFKSLFDLDFNHETKNSHQPKVNISESDKDYTLEFAVPGYKKEDLKVKIENDLLSVSAKIKPIENKEDRKVTRKEFSKKTFTRSFNIPEAIVEDQIVAHFENGILKLEVPKAIKEDSIKNIEIK